MKFPSYDHFITGTALPVSALCTKESCGIGEFLDLIPFGGLCKKCGIELIQILPINDTGTQISPYSALSAYALHPIYIRLQNLPGSKSAEADISALREKYAQVSRVAFEEVLKEKLKIAEDIYSARRKEIEADTALSNWIKENPWVGIYGAYKTLKSRYGEQSWIYWLDMHDPTPKAIERFWKSNHEEVLFHAWLQYHLEIQLKEASETLESIQIALKGDLPILMSEDSADVWMYRSFFQMNKRAGAPPDMYSVDGQNWGFPIYNWKELEKDNFIWWKERLKQAEKFYHAFRIDHVLGFFRIWAVPDHEESAAMGYYEPYKFISQQTLLDKGFYEARITWLSKPHIYLHEITKTLGDRMNEIMPYLKRIGEEDLFLFSDDIRGTADIRKLPLSDEAKQAMTGWYKNNTLIQVGKKTYFNTWYFTESRGYQSLNEHERNALYDIINAAGRASEKSWERKGKKLLQTLQETTDMLICAEDLGVVPACVPKVLRQLGMLSLKIGFWTREYSKPGHPFVPVRKYPFHSVATLSVHDSQVFRDWWETSATEDEKLGFCVALDIKDISGKTYSPVHAEKIIKAFFSASSFLAVLQIQDFLDLEENLREDPDLERINVPGTVSEMNWTYRLPITVEELMLEDALCSKVQKLTAGRRDRSLPSEVPV